MVFDAETELLYQEMIIHKGAKLAGEILSEMKITDDKETEIICSAIYHHDDKLVIDGPIDEVLKDADVMHHCMNDISKAVKEKEKKRYGNLCRDKMRMGFFRFSC